ncbi:hypothetical protein DP73_11150 [Desulfosporosinus sp. HMP52]|uniref:Ig-like domain-containing protein n=1 Tax=Desulfosporosinus sp. HMP52 TaxID=1487923 RepID=UPI00051FE5C8|nr:Ig-like domain-containing protein [Desulfosporosinus sp. HMP52]KGK89117.1 hypothetical protein DP73_11150 [Desulfosporosinus sp. HMP52]
MKSLKNTLMVSTLSLGLIMGTVVAVNAATSATVDTTIVQTQTAQPAVTGTVRAGDTAISGTAEAGATVSVKRSGTEIGTATADGTTGAYTVTLNSGVTLVEAEVLSITATLGATESNATSITVSVALGQTAQLAVTGTVRAGDTAISGTTEAGAMVSVKRSGTEIGTATADGTTGAYTVTLNSGVTLVEAEVLSLTATAPGKTESNAVSVTVAAAVVQDQTAQPSVTGTVKAGDTAISGTAEAGATVSVKRSGTEIGAATADGTTGAYTVTWNSGVTLVEGDALSITAITLGKTESNAVSVTVSAALIQEQTTQPTVRGTVRAGYTMIMGTAEAGATVSVKRSGTEIGTAISNTTGVYTVTMNSGVTLFEGDVLSITASAPEKTVSNAVSATVAAPAAPAVPPATVTPGQNSQYFCNNDQQWHSNKNFHQDQQRHNTQPRQSAQPSSVNKRTNTMNGNGYNSNHNENSNTNMGGNHMSGSRSGHE